MNYLQTDGVFGRTTAHIFYARDRLGTGSSCDVFKGVEKATGQTHALKVFKDAQWSSSEENIREVEALSKVTHPNIIGYYGREEEYGTGRGVLVMEYCSGGSLQVFLQEPENINGLEDKEFLVFLNDTCKGWKYLRQCGFVHRDIKPGNILRDVKRDGSVTYKLADFGASKQVENHGEFMSLAGTEEYLHPAVYEKAFIHPSGRTVFTESVDLWSLGVTIYHACTGEIPFKPYGGVRRNRSVMFMMITCKPRGVIAGDQMTASDDIRWRRTLPETSRLSPYIRDKTVEIIGGLLEADPSRQWTFRSLEDSVQRLVSLRKITVVNTEDSVLNTVYVSHKASLPELQEAITRVTEVPASHQMLFYQDGLLCDSDHCSWSASVLEEGEEEAVLLVTQMESNECLSQLSLGRTPTFNPLSTVEDDVKVALQITAFIYVLLIQTLQSWRVQRGQRQAQRSLWSHLKDLLHSEERKFKVLSETCREKQSRFETMREMESTRREISHRLNNHVTCSTNKAKRALSKLHQQLWRVKGDISCIREEVHSVCPKPPHSDRDQSMSHKEIQGIFDEAKQILRRMRKRKQEQPLSEGEETMHKKDRADLTQLSESCISHWQNRLLYSQRVMQLAFRETKSIYIRHYEKLLRVNHELEEVTKERSELSQALTETLAFLGRAWKDVVSNISNLFERSAVQMKTNTESSCGLKKDLDKSKERLKSLLVDLPDLELLGFDG